jgi:DMSO reductase anchor subunit
VQACPTEAIRIVKVRSQGSEIKDQKLGLFSSTIHNPHSAIPDFSITLPTTRYIGRDVPATAHAADRAALVPQHAHWPLVFMLVLTQSGVGILPASSSSVPLALTAAILFYLGMAASVFHLGQPLKAWRFFLGLKTSWLSREILAFSLYSPIPFVLCAFAFLPGFPFKSHFSLLTFCSALPLGLIAVFTSVMIYHDTRRSLWRFPRTATRFFGTVVCFVTLGNLISHPGSGIATMIFAAAVLLKLVPEIRMLQLGEDEDTRWAPDVHSARLQLGPLGIILRSRIALALIAIVAALFNPWSALPILLAAEIMERQLFFQSVQAPKMPGGFAPKNHSR